MKRFATSQTKDGQIAMDLKNFDEFFRHYCSRAYLSDGWNVMALCLLDMHFFSAVYLFHVNWPSQEFRSLVHESKYPQQWVFNSSKWTATGGEVDYGYEKIIDDMSNLMDYQHMLLYLCAIMLLMQTVMLLQYLVHLDPKLSVITEAIAFVGMELLHFFAAFFVIILAYALAGQFLYGADLAEFNDLSSSAQACFALMLGSGDFSRMQTVTAMGTNIFYWSWILLGLLIIMNLIIAILSKGHERASSVIYGDNEVGYHQSRSLPSKLMASVLSSPQKREREAAIEKKYRAAHKYQRRDLSEELAEIRLLVEMQDKMQRQMQETMKSILEKLQS